MTRLRSFILVLLALLLPVRGVVAATLMYPQAVEAGSAAEVDVGAHHDDHGLHHAGPASDEAQCEGMQAKTCHFCASACCMAAIVGEPPSLGAVALPEPAGFPALAAPAASHFSDGQERPPPTA